MTNLVHKNSCDANAELLKQLDSAMSSFKQLNEIQEE